ncbi:MAG: sugar phosphate isomerase/epimerase [Candidatus Dormibacteraeota bacterium]|nr:sugar phosphate isomerase/epimerase [Candidatus Dormibacteraeota bacterium]
MDSVEIADPYLSRGELPTIRQALDASGVSVDCYDVYCSLNEWTASSRRRQLNEVAAAFVRASQLGSHRVLLLPEATDHSVSPVVARARYGEVLREGLAIGRQLNVEVTVECLGSQAQIAGTAAQILALRERVGSELRVTYDAGNCVMAGEDSLDSLDRLSGLITHVHLKDWIVKPPQVDCRDRGDYPSVDGRCFEAVALGRGELPLHPVLDRLLEMRYSGALSIEYEGPDDSTNAVRAGVAFLQSFLQSRQPPSAR